MESAFNLLVFIILCFSISSLDFLMKGLCALEKYHIKTSIIIIIMSGYIVYSVTKFDVLKAGI